MLTRRLRTNVRIEIQVLKHMLDGVRLNAVKIEFCCWFSHSFVFYHLCTECERSTLRSNGALKCQI